MKAKYLYALLIVCLSLTACATSENDALGEAVGTVKYELKQTQSITPAPSPTITSTEDVFASSKDTFNVIDTDNASQLELVREWQINNSIFSSLHSDSYWFSDSDQFTVNIDAGIQSIEIGKLTPGWLIEQSGYSTYTIDQNDQIIMYDAGLHFFDRDGNELEKSEATDFCDEFDANFINTIPGTDLVITGHQDTYSEGGLNNTNSDDTFTLLLWNKTENTCRAIKRGARGFLHSISVSPDGRYISYGYGIRDLATWLQKEPTVKVYDMNAQEDKCSFPGLFAAFNRVDQLAIANPYDSTITLASPENCTTRLKFDDPIGTWKLLFDPAGDILASSSDTKLILYETDTGDKVKEFDFIPSTVSIELFGLSPDGRFLLTSSDSDLACCVNTIMLWGIPGK
jgi:WD40 repeat protein